MAIRKKLEFNGKHYTRVDLKTGVDYDSLELAKECLMFMVVSVNENWKISIVYF